MFTVRSAQDMDIAAVDALLSRAYPRLLAPDYSADVLKAALPAISRAQPDLVTCGTYFLVEEEGALLGAGGWTTAPPGGGAPETGTAHIRHVVTDDRAVRRGVGQALMAHVFATARALDIAQLECLSTLTAQPFYAAMGFETCGTVDVPLSSGVSFPAVRMRCTGFHFVGLWMSNLALLSVRVIWRKTHDWFANYSKQKGPPESDPDFKV